MKRKSWTFPENPTEVKLELSGPFGERTSKGLTPAQKKGLKYQRFVKEMISKRLPHWELLDGPWISYSESFRGQYWAQPDFVLLRGAGDGMLVEAKLSRCFDAELQLERIYLPLARLVWPGRTWRRVAVCHNWAGPGSPVEDYFIDPTPDRLSWVHFMVRSL